MWKPAWRADSGGAASATSKALVIPATAKVGQVAVFALQVDGGPAITVPTGFTQTGTVTGGGGSRVFACIKQLVSGDLGATVTASWTGAQFSEAEMIGLEWSGTSIPTVSVDGSNTGASVANGTAITAPSITTATARAGVVVVVGNADAGGTHTSDRLLRINELPGIATFTGLQAAAGATGTRALTQSVSSDWGAITFGITGGTGTAQADVYQIWPDANSGFSMSSGASAWGAGGYVDLLPGGWDYPIALDQIEFKSPAAPALTTTYEALIEIATGAAGSETVIAQLPWTFRNVTAVGYLLGDPIDIQLPEPISIAAGTRVAIRVSDSHTAALAYTGVKPFFREVAAVGGPIVGTVGVASETDAAQATSRYKRRDTGVATGVNTAQAITIRKYRLVGQTVESDSPQAITIRKYRLVGTSTEPELAQATVRYKRSSVALPTETESGQAVPTRKYRVVGLASSVHTAQAITRVKYRAVGLAAETPLAQATVRVKRIAAAFAQETETAQTTVRVKRIVVSPAVEADSAPAAHHPVPIVGTVAQATETDASQAITKIKVKAAAQTVESAIAQVVTSFKRRSAGLASTADAAMLTARTKVKSAGQVVEAGLAQAVTSVKRLTVALPQETDQAQTATRVKRRVVNAVVENQTAQPISLRKYRVVGVASEVDQAILTRRMGLPYVLSPVSESDQSLPVTRIKRKTAGPAFSAELAGDTIRFRRRDVQPAQEVVIARPIVSLKIKQADVATTVETASPVLHVASRIVGVATELDAAGHGVDASRRIVSLRPTDSGGYIAVGAQSGFDQPDNSSSVTTESTGRAVMEFDGEIDDADTSGGSIQ